MFYTKVVNLEVNKIKKWDINPRVIDKKQMEKLKEKISRYPFFIEQRPILVSEQNGEYVVFAGNQRLEAARQLGWKEVPVVIFTDIEERVKKDLSIIDNKNDGEWDFSKLALNFKEVQTNLSQIVKRVKNKSSFFNYTIVQPRYVLNTLHTHSYANFILADAFRCINRTEIIHASSFPDDYNFLDEKIKTISWFTGMSVPPLMGYKIAQQIVVQLF